MSQDLSQEINFDISFSDEDFDSECPACAPENRRISEVIKLQKETAENKVEQVCIPVNPNSLCQVSYGRLQDQKIWSDRLILSRKFQENLNKHT